MPERFKVVLDHARRYTSARLYLYLLPPVLRRFQVMADYWSNFRYR